MKIKLKLNLDLGGKYKKGMLVSIEVDREGTPLERFWRNRMRDSKLDNCVEIVKAIQDIKEKKGGKK